MRTSLFVLLAIVLCALRSAPAHADNSDLTSLQNLVRGPGRDVGEQPTPFRGPPTEVLMSGDVPRNEDVGSGFQNRFLDLRPHDGGAPTTSPRQPNSETHSD